MNGVDADGRPVTVHRREARRPVPSGPMPLTRVLDARRSIVRGLTSLGYTAGQIGQVLTCSERSIRRYLAANGDPADD